MFNFWLRFLLVISTLITVKCVSVSSDSKNKTVISNTTNLYLVYPIKQLNTLKEGKILKLDVSQDLGHNRKDNSKKMEDKNVFVVFPQSSNTSIQSSNETINKKDEKEQDIQLFPVNNEKLDDLIADASQIHEITYSESTTQKPLSTHNFKDSTSSLPISSTTGTPDLTKFHSNRGYKSQFKTKINQISTSSSPTNSLARNNQTRIILENRRMSLLNAPRSPFLKKPITMNKTKVDEFEKVLRDSTTMTMEKNEMKIPTSISSSMARNGSGSGGGAGTGSDERRNLTARRRAMRHFY